MPIVYILTNESMPDIIKIGTTDNLQRRMRDLDNTSVPLPFECFYALKFEDTFGIERRIEKLLHETFDDKKVRQNREFFNCTPEQAKSALRIAEIMGGKNVTPTELIIKDEQDRQALNTAKRKKGRIDYFGSLKINAGEILTFLKDTTITCEVADNRQVRFREEVTSLTGAARTILNEMGYDWPQVNGACYWCYKEKTLWDLYRQTQDS